MKKYFYVLTVQGILSWSGNERSGQEIRNIHFAGHIEAINEGDVYGRVCNQHFYKIQDVPGKTTVMLFNCWEV